MKKCQKKQKTKDATQSLIKLFQTTFIIKLLFNHVMS